MSPTTPSRSSEQPALRGSGLRVYADRCGTWFTENKLFFLLAIILIAIVCVPLYGVRFPPSADLSLHILISKLLWEKLAGVSHLDIEVSWYLGYRLWAYLIVAVIVFCKAVGMSLLQVPKLVAAAVLSIHAIVVAWVCYTELRTRPWKSRLPAICLMLPAAVCVYSSAWYTGFAGFTMGVSFLVVAVVFAERFLESGRKTPLIVVFLALAAAFGCHPFAIAFWLLWCASRGLASLMLFTIRREWKDFIYLGLITMPILLYHFIATARTEVSTPDESGMSSPILAASVWYDKRLLGLLKGAYLWADDAADPKIFALLALGLIVLAAVLVFFRRNALGIRAAGVAGIIFLFVGSWINEDFIPVPKGHWLAYDLRFASAAYAICLTVAGIALIRCLPIDGNRRPFNFFINSLAAVCAVVSVYQLVEVRDAYARFDAPARMWVEKMLQHEKPLAIRLPTSPWYQGAELFLRRYRCLDEADCNPAGTLFNTIGGDVYPVRVKSPRRTLEPNADLAALYGPPGSAFAGGCGFAGGEFARPRGLAVDDAENIYVADTGNGRVQKFDRDGKFLFQFGRYGTNEGEFDEPTGIAVAGTGSIYVTDPPGQKLMRFRPDGTFDKEWKGPNRGFKRPIDIALGPNGLLYITDLDAHAVVKFDPVNETSTRFGNVGKGNGGFDTLAGVGIGGGMVFVADVGNDLIQVFDLDGNFLRQWEVKPWSGWHFHYPDIAYDEQVKRLYVTNGGFSSDALLYVPDGTLIFPIKADDDNLPLINPSSILISNSGGNRRMYILNTGSDVKDFGDPRVSVIRLGG